MRQCRVGDGMVGLVEGLEMAQARWHGLGDDTAGDHGVHAMVGSRWWGVGLKMAQGRACGGAQDSTGETVWVGR